MIKTFPQSVLNMKSLCDYLVINGVIRSPEVYFAMLNTDRADFIDPNLAYFDNSQSINYNSIISAPHMHAYPLEYLKDNLKPGKKVLDVGSGSGYL
jgi:protein-L-isoaspartate(D-aspartate) O-methyltransferase